MVGDRKHTLFFNVYREVLKIGLGSGSNLPYHPKDIHWIGI